MINNKNLRRRTLQIALLCVLVSHFARLSPAAARTSKATVLYQQVVDSTVWILNPAEECSGTGWIIDAEKGLVVTNHHVVGTAVDVHVCFPQQDESGRYISSREFYLNNQQSRRTGTVIASDPVRDLAVVQIQDFPNTRLSLPLAAESASPGESIISVGNPGVSGGLWVFTRGEVRIVYEQTGYRVEGPVEYRVLESSSAINSGDSGGPAVNEDGEIIGVSAAYRKDGRLVSHFVDVTTLQKFMQEVNDLVGPTSAAQFVERGSLHQAAKRFGSAMADYNKALRLQPKNSDALAGRGTCFSRTGDLVSARADFEEALKVDQQNVQACIGLARLVEGSDKDRAISLVTNAIRSPQSPATMCILFAMRGKYFFDKNDLQNSLSDLNRATEITPLIHEAWNVKGQICLILKKYEAAEKLFGYAIDAAVKLDVAQNHSDYFYYRALALYVLGKTADAWKNIQLAMKLSQPNAGYYFLAGKIAEANGDKESSNIFLAAAENLDPENYSQTPVVSGSWSTSARSNRGTYRIRRGSIKRRR